VWLIVWVKIEIGKVVDEGGVVIVTWESSKMQAVVYTQSLSLVYVVTQSLV